MPQGTRPARASECDGLLTWIARSSFSPLLVGRPFRAHSDGAFPGLKAWAVLLNRFAVRSDRHLRSGKREGSGNGDAIFPHWRFFFLCQELLSATSLVKPPLRPTRCRGLKVLLETGAGRVVRFHYAESKTDGCRAQRTTRTDGGREWCAADSFHRNLESRSRLASRKAAIIAA